MLALPTWPSTFWTLNFNMILSRKNKYVFISTPKTGTHSFYKLLQDEFDGERLKGNYHRTEMPDNADEYLVFSTVRNPYDRLVAIWNSVLHAKNERNNYRDEWLATLRKDDFLTFAKFAAKYRNDIEYRPVRSPYLLMPQCRWYNKMPEGVTPLHLENISVEFHSLPFVNKEVEIPHMLKRDHASWDEIKTDEITSFVNEWAGEDFEKFGYEKEEV